jgi:hypothetical protein
MIFRAVSFKHKIKKRIFSKKKKERKKRTFAGI